MSDLDAVAFAHLFEEAYVKCFGYPPKTSLTESESRHLSNDILAKTGLVIGWKSLKNYSCHFLNESVSRRENPSVATLDTLARYVSGAPPTNEIQRKDNEGHYPYWFEYRSRFGSQDIVGGGGSSVREMKTPKKATSAKRLVVAIMSFAGLTLIIALIISLHPFGRGDTTNFTDEFHSVGGNSLANRGWIVNSVDPQFWKRRGELPGVLTLFTLRGDNWPDSGYAAGINDLLLRKITGSCFTAEVHMTGFIPTRNWEQAGIILLEDTTFTGKSLRLSISYNDYSGGYPKSRDILVQGVYSLGRGFSKPEEIAHETLFRIGSDSENIITENLRHSGLRIEKVGDRFRLLFSDGAMENSAFKEVVSREFDMKPNYVGIFALKGFVGDSVIMPVHFSFFRLTSEPCRQDTQRLRN